MTARVYLDWNATEPLRPKARAAMVAALDLLGNPSSVHGEGRAARAVIERAREQVAGLAGCKPKEIVFTSGATEAAGVLSRLSDAVCVAPTAHDAVWAHAAASNAQGSADQDGVLAMGLANSETGILSDPPAAVEGRWVHDAGAARILFLDATQLVARAPWSFAWSGAQLACFSAHKIGGPKGVGALIVRDGFDVAPLALGGGQELGRRSGTENLAGIAGFGAAAEAAAADLANGVWEEVGAKRDFLEATLEVDARDTIFVGKEERRLPNTTCFATPGWSSSTQVMQMDLGGFAISAGAACSSGKVRESRVLRAMGYDEAVAQSAVRVSIGPQTTQEDVLGFAECWLRQLRRFEQKRAA